MPDERPTDTAAVRVDPGPQGPAVAGEEPAGAWVPLPDATAPLPTTVPVPPVPVPPVPPVGDEDGDDEDWMASPVARGVRLRVPTLILLALGVAAAAFWGGAVAQRHHGTGATASASLAARARSFARGGTGAAGGFGAAAGGFGGGAGGGAAAGGPATRGLVSDVQGPVIQLTDSSGAPITVHIGPSTTVTRTGTGTPGALQIGDTVIARGTTGADGSITATSIVATAQGLTSTGAGG